MDANRQQSSSGTSNGTNKKGKIVQVMHSGILNYSSDKINDREVSRLTDDVVKLSRSKRKLKIGGKIGKGSKKNKKNTRKPSLLERLNTKKNRETARDIAEETVDYFDDYDDIQLQNALDSKLIKSVKQSNLNKVEEWINMGANVNTKDSNGLTPLHIASKRGYSDIAKFLIDKGADVHAQENKLGQEPLHLASAKGHLDIVKLLLDKGADVRVQENLGLEPLHLASLKGHLDIVKYLVEKGSDVDAFQGGGGYGKPLHFAARKGHFLVVKYLIEKGANPDAKDGDGKTAMERASERGITDIADYLKVRMKQVTEMRTTTEGQNVTEVSQVTEGQNITEVPQISDGQQFTTERHYVNVTTNISNSTEEQTITEGQQAINKDGYSSIHSAAIGGNLNAVKYFIEKGTDVNVKDETDYTPLHLACRFEKLDVVKYLIEKGANVNIKGGYLQYTPLYEAIDSGSLEIVKYLKENGANINDTDKNRVTPLHHAASNGNFDIAKYLVEKRANIRAIDAFGNTPLHEAARGGSSRLVEYLVEYDIGWRGWTDLNIKNNNRETALHIAARKGNLSMVKYLVEKNAYTYVQDKDGNTPLHLAIIYNSERVGKFLFEQGANLEIRNNNGKTPIELAYGRGRRDTSNNSWINNRVVNWVKDLISFTRSPGLLTSREHSDPIVAAVPEINTTVLNNTMILGILAAGLFNKTQCKQSIPENLLSEREQLMRNIDDSSRILEQSLRKGEEEGWDTPNIDEDDIEFSENKTRNVEK